MTELRAITVKNPWAWAIAHGGKNVENRSRGVSYRGPLAIHAGLSWSDQGGTDVRVIDAAHRERTGRRNMIAGAIVAVVDLVDSHSDTGCCRPWGDARYDEGQEQTAVHHLVLENVQPVAEPVRCRGALGLWRPSTAVTDLLTLVTAPSLSDGDA